MVWGKNGNVGVFVNDGVYINDRIHSCTTGVALSVSGSRVPKVHLSEAQAPAENDFLESKRNSN